MKFYSDDVKFMMQLFKDFKRSLKRSKFTNVYNETFIQIMLLDRIANLSKLISTDLMCAEEEMLKFKLKTMQITKEEYDEAIELLNEFIEK